MIQPLDKVEYFGWVNLSLLKYTSSEKLPESIQLVEATPSEYFTFTPTETGFNLSVYYTGHTGEAPKVVVDVNFGNASIIGLLLSYSASINGDVEISVYRLPQSIRVTKAYVRGYGVLGALSIPFSSEYPIPPNTPVRLELKFTSTDCMGAIDVSTLGLALGFIDRIFVGLVADRIAFHKVKLPRLSDVSNSEIYYNIEYTPLGSSPLGVVTPLLLTIPYSVRLNPLSLERVTAENNINVTLLDVKPDYFSQKYSYYIYHADVGVNVYGSPKTSMPSFALADTTGRIISQPEFRTRVYVYEGGSLKYSEYATITNRVSILSASEIESGRYRVSILQTVFPVEKFYLMVSWDSPPISVLCEPPKPIEINVSTDDYASPGETITVNVTSTAKCDVTEFSLVYEVWGLEGLVTRGSISYPSLSPGESASNSFNVSFDPVQYTKEIPAVYTILVYEPLTRACKSTTVEVC